MKLYVFGNLICNDRSNGKDLVFQIVAQQEVPDGAHGYHGKTVTEFPSDLTQYYHKQDVEESDYRKHFGSYRFYGRILYLRE